MTSRRHDWRAVHKHRHTAGVPLRCEMRWNQWEDSGCIWIGLVYFRKFQDEMNETTRLEYTNLKEARYRHSSIYLSLENKIASCRCDGVCSLRGECMTMPVSLTCEFQYQICNSWQNDCHKSNHPLVVIWFEILESNLPLSSNVFTTYSQSIEGNFAKYHLNRHSCLNHWVIKL